jgi:hypothetical protein
MIIYGFVASAVQFIISTWILIFKQARWARIYFASSLTFFVSYLLFIMYDFAQWVGKSNIFIINLIDQAVRFLQHSN